MSLGIFTKVRNLRGMKVLRKERYATLWNKPSRVSMYFANCLVKTFMTPRKVHLLSEKTFATEKV